ncbi:CBS domain-containing protein [Peribacillus faecalis]|nr:CBS domain-containing protein [Peribacillus faecalis]
MKTDVDSVFEDTLLRDAARQMSIKSLRFLPVVNRNYRLIGILTRTNLVDAIYESIWGNEEVEESI